MGKVVKMQSKGVRRCGPKRAKEAAFTKTYRMRRSVTKTNAAKSYAASLARMNANPVPALKEEERKALLAFKLVDEAEGYNQKVDIIQNCKAFNRQHVFNGICEDCFRMLPNNSYCALCGGPCTEGHQRGIRYEGNLAKDKKADPYFVPIVLTSGQGTFMPRFMMAGLGCKCPYNFYRDGAPQN
nr:hypothetical protein [Sicyoidochytrium minutum DNA virus]